VTTSIDAAPAIGQGLLDVVLTNADGLAQLRAADQASERLTLVATGRDILPAQSEVILDLR
jgi:hypothetical protein